MLNMPTMPPGDPLVVSASLFTTYLRCPAQALAQAQGIYGPESRASFIGMLAHRIFARHLSGGRIESDRLNAACREEIGQAMNPKLASLQLRPSELRGVIAEVGALYDRFQAISTDGCRSIELELEAAWGADVTLRGRIDAVFDDPRGVRLVDWKTGALAAAKDQLAFYALLWTLAKGEPPAVVEAASVSSGERFEQIPEVATLAATGRALVELVSTIRAGFADAAAVARVGGPGCRYCPLHDDCAEGQAALRVLSA